MPRVEIFIQARTGSTRLPGKVLKEVCGMSLLEHLIRRMKRIKDANAICILTTTNLQDDAIVRIADKCQVASFRGPEEDVLTRYFQAALRRGAEGIVRLTSDCPLLDPTVVDDVIRAYRAEYYDFDYFSNTLERTYPRGMDVELFTMQALENAHVLGSSDAEREHVTLAMYKNPDLFRLKNIVSPKSYPTDLRLTVDTEEDFQLISRIFEMLYPMKPDFTLDDVVDLMEHHPELAKLNAHVKQKPTH